MLFDNEVGKEKSPATLDEKTITQQANNLTTLITYE
jgi:hypothetical protein